MSIKTQMNNGVYMNSLDDLTKYNILHRDARIAHLEKELDETKKRLASALKVGFQQFMSV